MSLDNKNMAEFANKYLDPFKEYTESTFPSIPDIRSIDHILLDKRFKYKKERIHSDANDYGYMSDHYPMSCEITINK